MATETDVGLKRSGWIVTGAIFALNLALNAPIFQFGETPYRGTIEGGYISMSRFIAAHPSPWGWNPTQYCGLPVQFTYLPGLHYVDTFFSLLLPRVPMENIYRVVTATAACFTPAAVFLLALALLRQLRWAAAAAVLVSVVSPLYGLFTVIDKDRGLIAVPWGIQVLLKYGEGPHILALAILPLAVWAAWSAATGRSFARIFFAAVLLASVALTNWIAALALAICCLSLMTAYAGAGGFRITRVIASAVLAYLLACFWLTPSYIQTTAFNWPLDAFNYKFQQQQIWLGLGLVAGFTAIRAIFLRFPNQRYFCFLCLACFTLGYLVAGFYGWHVDTLPESRRYALEFSLFLVLALVEAFRLALRAPDKVVRQCAVGAAVVLLLWEVPHCSRYLLGGWKQWKAIPKESTVEYKLAQWVEARRVQGRVYASGGLRYRINQWTDLHQVGGGFESGLRNRVPLHFGYQIRAARGDRPAEMPADTLLQLRALGVEYVVVHGQGSQEYYNDFRGLERFPLIAREVYRDGPDAVYQVDGWAMAHLVRPEELPRERPLYGTHGRARSYVEAMLDPQRPKLRSQWLDASSIRIEGGIPAGMQVAVAVNFDPGWVATQDGVPLPVNENTMGFIALPAQPAQSSRIELRYRGTAEQKTAAGVSVLALLGSFGGLLVDWRRNRRTA